MPSQKNDNKKRSKIVYPSEEADRPSAAGQTQSGSGPNNRVAERAFEKFLARGGEHGHDQEDWLRAEEELAAERVETSESADEASADSFSELPEPDQRDGVQLR